MSPGAREAVVVQRQVKAQQVPSGDWYLLEPGLEGWLTQALGSSYTVMADGLLWRIDGADGDAIGMPCRKAAPRDAEPSDEELERWVWEELGQIYDPEIPCSIVELGLVYRCDLRRQEDGRFDVRIEMTLTAPGCGMGRQLADEVAERLLALPRVARAEVDVVFDPPWDRSMMSEAARLALGLL